jgi:hypothetical protein
MAIKMAASIPGRELMKRAAAVLMGGQKVGELANDVTMEAPLVAVADPPVVAVPLWIIPDVLQVLVAEASVPSDEDALAIVIDIMLVINGGIGYVDVVDDDAPVVIDGAVTDDDIGIAVAPSMLPGMAEPTPELVKGVGIGRSDTSGLSAGSRS